MGRGAIARFGPLKLICPASSQRYKDAECSEQVGLRKLPHAGSINTSRNVIDHRIGFAVVTPTLLLKWDGKASSLSNIANIIPRLANILTHANEEATNGIVDTLQSAARRTDMQGRSSVAQGVAAESHATGP